MTSFRCTADLVGQLNGNGQKGMLQIDAPPPVENFWLRHCDVTLFSQFDSTPAVITSVTNQWRFRAGAGEGGTGPSKS